MASVYANLWEQERFHIKIWNTKMAGLTSCENALLSVFTHVADIYVNVLGQKKAFIRKEFNSHGTCLEHEYGLRDVMWKRSIGWKHDELT